MCDFEIIETTAAKKQNSQKAIITIVNSSNNGKRVEICKDVVNKITNDPEPKIKIGVNETGIAIIPSSNNSDTLRRTKYKYVRYSSALVNKIFSRFSIMFENEVSNSFYDLTYLEVDGKKVAFVPILEEEELSEEEEEELFEEEEEE